MRAWRDPILGCGLVTQLTVTVVTATLLPLIFGIWLDRQLHTAPFISLFMTGLGITIGTVSVYRSVIGIYKQLGEPKA